MQRQFLIQLSLVDVQLAGWSFQDQRSCEAPWMQIVERSCGELLKTHLEQRAFETLLEGWIAVNFFEPPQKNFFCNQTSQMRVDCGSSIQIQLYHLHKRLIMALNSHIKHQFRSCTREAADGVTPPPHHNI